MAKKPEKKSWLVNVRCTVLKQLATRDCTEEQARTTPFEFSIDETELDCIDSEVISVEPND